MRPRTANGARTAEYGDEYETANSRFGRQPGGRSGAKAVLSPDQIPGVSRGMPKVVRSVATDIEPKVSIYKPGDRIRHVKLGTGTVTEISGTGGDTRVRILFDEGRESVFKLSVTPIVKIG